MTKHYIVSKLGYLAERKSEHESEIRIKVSEEAFALFTDNEFAAGTELAELHSCAGVVWTVFVGVDKRLAGLEMTRKINVAA